MESVIRDLEESLRLAMLASDVPTLERLISDSLLFVGPDGTTFRKQDDLDLHRSRRQKLDRADWEEVKVETYGSAAVSVVTAYLAGSFDGADFSGRFRYIRMWTSLGSSWKVIGGSVTAVAS
ncbi:nuclear transport factor 2 family protein [Luteimonas sp. SJ-92]|uniref:Nuclear transport factor 2 family protein n=1 Tax=Luteimonas salinisoli TaxID=2752307 RepID=A0A853JCA9_9GAMM|nr:nuclear transport factor 2 family protein [Luteimonas salinisoli]NZA26248.1 nuclear transport factor 2 family protein [Luteimonas salinisoli]